MRCLWIVMVTPKFHPSTGGVETHVEEVGSRLVDRGHRVTVVTADADRGLDPQDGFRGLSVVRVPGWPRGRDLRLAPGLPAALRALPADIVHVQSYHTLVAPMGLAATVLAERPSVLTFHSGGHSSSARERLRTLQLLALRPLLRATDRLIAVSAHEAEVLARRLRLSRRRFEVLPNGADLPAVEVAGREPDLVVSVGRLEAYKGHELAIRALPILRERRPGVRLRIAGRGPDESRLRAIAARLGVADRVTIEAVPAGDRRSMAELLGRAGVVALLSRYESQGIGAWEAVGTGASVVVTDGSALRELVERGLAWAVPPGADPDLVAGALDAASRAGPRARAPMVPTWDATVDGLERVYEDVLARRAA